MRKFKRLNRKGFTLIELLAVIVILAIVMGIAATNVLNSINSSRKSALYSASQNAANTLNTWVSEDMLVVENGKKKLGDDFVKYTQDTKKDTWVCLNDSNLKIMNAAGTANTTILSALSLSSTDLKTDGSVPSWSNNKYTINMSSTCSAVRYNTSTGGYEFLFVASTTGKFYVSNDAANNYAFSRATKSGESLTTQK